MKCADAPIGDMPLDAAGARAFFEQNFRPVRLTKLGEKEGFFTGYYEPVVEGARYPSDIYTVPLYRRPNDMVTQRLRRSGKQGAGRQARGEARRARPITIARRSKTVRWPAAISKSAT